MKNTAIEPEARGPSGEWRAALARFDEELRRRAVAEPTRSAHAAELRQFAGWASWHGVPPAAVDVRVVRRFATALADGRASPAAIARKLATLRAFFEAVHERGEIDANPVAGLADDGNGGLAPEQMSRLLDRVPAATALQLRDRALFELAYATGLRAEQLVALDVACVDVAGERVRVAAGAGARSVAPGPPAMRALAHYLQRARAALCSERSEAALFVSKTGRRLSASDARRRLRALARNARMHSGHPSQALRRSLQTRLLEAGTDARSIRDLLGDGPLSTTRTYTRVESARLRSAYARAHPRA